MINKVALFSGLWLWSYITVCAPGVWSLSNGHPECLCPTLTHGVWPWRAPVRPHALCSSQRVSLASPPSDPLLWRTDQHLALASAGGAWLGAWPASFIGSLPPFCSSPHSCSLLIVPTHLLPFPLLTSNFRFCHQKDVCCSCRLGVLKIFLKEVKLT